MTNASNKTIYILGINCAYHESSVALLRTGATGLELVGFAEEERFNRIKRAKPPKTDNADELPLLSMQWVLDRAGISLAEVAHIATSMDPDKRRRDNMLHPHRYEVPAGDFGTPEGEQLFYQKVRNIEAKARNLGFAGQFHYLGHHACHSASSFYVSGFSDAVSVVVDGVSEFESLSIFDCEGNCQKLLYTMDYPNSMGFLWEKISEFVGFSVYDSGKWQWYLKVHELIAPNGDIQWLADRLAEAYQGLLTGKAVELPPAVMDQGGFVGREACGG